MLGTNLVIPAQICDELLHGKAAFAIILSQNDQHDLDGQGQGFPFVKYQPKVSHDACFVQIQMLLL